MKLIKTAMQVRTWENVDRTMFDKKIAPLGRPAVLRGLVKHWPAVKTAASGAEALFDYLRGVSNDKPVECFAGAESMQGYFNYASDLKGFNFERKSMTLDRLMTALADENQAEAPFLYAGGVNVPDHLPSFAADHDNPLLGDNVDQLMSIWIGNRTRVPAHWDLPQNIACVVTGQRRFMLFPIGEVPNLYIGPLDRTLAGQPSSLVDPLDPDLERFPRFVDAARHALVATLEPGDALYIPSLWLHHVESLDDLGLMVNFWWREGPAHMFTPLLTLMHGLLSIRGMPDAERDGWRCLFEHYLFGATEESLEHLPADARGVLGDLGPEDESRLRRFLASRLIGRPIPPGSDGQ